MTNKTLTRFIANGLTAASKQNIRNRWHRRHEFHDRQMLLIDIATIRWVQTHTIID